LLEAEYQLNAGGGAEVLSLAADASIEADVKVLVDESVKNSVRLII
jgi:hypothetical protein